MPSVAQTKRPEALDAEFLDYLAACEHPDGNWTVVAEEDLRKKAKTERAPERPSDRDAKPKAVRP